MSLNGRLTALEAKAARLLAAAEPFQSCIVWCENWGADCRKPNCDCKTPDGELAFRRTGRDGDRGAPTRPVKLIAREDYELV